MAHCYRILDGNGQRESVAQHPYQCQYRRLINLLSNPRMTVAKVALP